MILLLNFDYFDKIFIELLQKHHNSVFFCAAFIFITTNHLAASLTDCI